MDFLKKDPSEWKDDTSFQSSQQSLCGITTVSDFAERGVALIQDYSLILTNDKQQRQYLLQVMDWHHCQYPDMKKIATPPDTSQN